MPARPNVIESTVTMLGYDLVDVEKSAGGLLRVYIDHPAPGEGGEEKFITVDDCERVTRQLQHVLEVEGVPYERLEVSSPGLDRLLKKAADFARFVGQQVELTLKAPLAGRKRFRGELRAEGDGWRLVLSPDHGGSPEGDRVLDFAIDEVREARLVPTIDFKGRRSAPAPAAQEEGGAPGAAHGGQRT
nr:ribosome maturation factor RimP [Schlegelella koreensis]